MTHIGFLSNQLLYFFRLHYSFDARMCAKELAELFGIALSTANTVLADADTSFAAAVRDVDTAADGAALADIYQGQFESAADACADLSDLVFTGCARCARCSAPCSAGVKCTRLECIDAMKHASDSR